MQKEDDIMPSWGKWVIAFFIILVFAYGIHSKGFCLFAQNEDKYYDNSPCFDFDYRCQVECGRYGLEFTGITDGCSCDCGTGWVSSCSGFYYDKESNKTLMRITGDEICEYSNGTSEPCGYEAGVYETEREER